MLHHFFAKHRPSTSIVGLGPSKTNEARNTEAKRKKRTINGKWHLPSYDFDPKSQAWGHLEVGCGKRAEREHVSWMLGFWCDLRNLKGPWYPVRQTTGGKRLLLPHSCRNSLFIPASSGTAFKSILIDGIFCRVSSGRRIYLLHRQFLWFEQDSPTPFKLHSVWQNTHAHLLPLALWPLGFLSL